MGKVGAAGPESFSEPGEGFILKVAEHHWRVITVQFTFLNNLSGCSLDGRQGTRRQLGVQLPHCCHSPLRGTVMMVNFVCHLG